MLCPLCGNLLTGSAEALPCPSCGTEYPASANFCLKCGAALRRSGEVAGSPGWEYQYLSIGLGMSYPDLAAPESAEGFELRAKAQARITEELARAERDGWQPDEPVDLDALLTNDRVARGRGLQAMMVESLSVRLKRPIP
jgi:hypothetical protein